MALLFSALMFGCLIVLDKHPRVRTVGVVKTWRPHPKYPIQCDNSTAVGVANDTIIQRKTKNMNMHYHWIRCREAQSKFRFLGLLVPTILPIIAQKTTPPFITSPIGLPMQVNHTLFVHCKGV